MGEKVYGLLGRTLGHSWSVPIHASLGCPDYRLIELEPDALGDFLRREDIGGLNVTIPYKRDVMAWCDAIDPAAAEIGSVNTLVRRDGKLYGYNTDIDGFRYMLRRAGICLAGKKVLVLGSGGASLTARAAARQAGAREIVVISRSGPDSYEDLAQRHGDAEAVVNTTPVGMWPKLEGRPVDLRDLPRVTDLADVVYNPGRTDLLLQAEALNKGAHLCRDARLHPGAEAEPVRHIRYTGGLPMLVAQAKRAEELFFGKALPDGVTEEIVARLWRERTNLVLVGMPGCGKTTVGRALAELSGRPFVDLDGEIVRRAGRPIPEIFATEGEDAFRSLERQILAETCAKSGQVIATGGGAVLRPGNRAAMRRTGRVYWLLRDLKDLPTAGRPLSQAGSLEEMYRTRAPLYGDAADVRVENSGPPAGTAERIWREFCGDPGDQRPEHGSAGRPPAGDLRQGHV